MTIGSAGVLYVVNSTPGLGIERNLNPTAAEPEFETVNRGLDEDATLYGLWQAGHRLWSVDTTGIRLMTFADTLTLPPVLLSPERAASAIGELIDHTVRDIALDWETMDGATSYEWECSFDDDFSSGHDKITDTTTATSVRLPALEPATTYHWRVRASGPAYSPWSEKRSFTTVMDIEAVALKPEIPAPGATGVERKPVFQWTAVVGARAYELLVATDAEMNNRVFARMDAEALPANVWPCEVNLEYATTYYWKVRAVGVDTRSAWSTTGVFTTAPFAPPTASPEKTPLSVQDQEVANPTSIYGTVAALAATPPPAASRTVVTDGLAVPNFSELSALPGWILYLVGILLSIIILTLLIILVIVVRIKRLP
jgi:hypothetical protein